jgi:hypothetical protein
MDTYFKSKQETRKGTPPTTLAHLLHKDLNLIHKSLKSTADLEQCRQWAQGREQWKLITDTIIKKHKILEENNVL